MFLTKEDVMSMFMGIARNNNGSSRSMKFPSPSLNVARRQYVSMIAHDVRQERSTFPAISVHEIVDAEYLNI